jgi:D-proline reductase (dithiol) PrdB
MTHVKYMERIRDFYRAQGYEKDYVWAHYDDVPFTPLKKKLSESVVALFSTSDVSIKRPEGVELPDEETRVGEVYSVPWNTPTDQLYSRQESYDSHATNLDDVDAYLPLTRLREYVEAGRIGATTANFHNINRGYSHRLMLDTAAPAALAKCLDEGADVAVFTPV